ncbi:MAG TPA: hypothetical protein VE177_07550 [Candidatus Binatus sp.]|nr:hypothetical protein [Candidatus Binatus sp.]
MSVKVMIAFGPQTYSQLNAEARERGVSVQELLRAVIIPEWFKVKEIPRNGISIPELSRIRPTDIREAATTTSPLQRIRS